MKTTMQGKAGPPKPAAPKPKHDELRSADAIFTRLMRDLNLADRARKRILKGTLLKPMWKADKLERESLKYLAAYLSAAGWASNAGGVEASGDNEATA
jgi:hypothetical protein